MIVNVIFLIVLIIFVLIFVTAFVAFLLNIQCFKELSKRNKRTTIRDSITTIDDAYEYIQKLKLKDWELVKACQHIVSEKMNYSVLNSYDTPKRAFSRGIGYCWHYTSSLKILLKKFGIESLQVQAFRNKFDSFKVDGVNIDDKHSGHTWLKVKIGSELKDVCPINPKNEPGIIDFSPLSRVTKFGPIVSLMTYFFSPLVNANRYMHVKKEKSNEAGN